MYVENTGTGLKLNMLIPTQVLLINCKNLRDWLPKLHTLKVNYSERRGCT